MDTYSSGEDLVIKTRKPYTITKQRERWTEEEHNRFLEALKLYGRAWQRIEEHIGTKTAVQIRSHAQKFFSKLEKEAVAKGVPIGQALEINIPPPRPKKKPSNPYPRKKGVGTPASQAGAKDGKLLTSTSFPHCSNVLELVKEPCPEKHDGDGRPTNAKENQDDNCSEVFTLLQEAHCSSVASVNKNSVPTLEVLKKTSSFREFVPSPKKGNHDARNESFITVEHEANEKLDSSDAKQTAWDNGTVKASKSENSCPLHEKFFQQKKSDDFIGSVPTDEMQAMQNYPRHVPVHVLNGSLGTCMTTPPSDLSFQDSMFHPDIKSNCSTSCDCSPAGGQSGGTWTCTCSSDGLPKVATGIQDTTCFTACNCTSGSLTDVQATRKHISSKIVVVIVLLCVILTTLAFLASIACYLYRKDKGLIQSPVFLSDRETSCNSSANLISHRASSVSETKIRVDSLINPISGCFHMASFLCGSKTEIIHGTLLLFTYSELEHATNKFSHSNLIGLGGSSYVYHGQLKDGRTVAVKQLKAQGGPDADFLFLTEVELLAKLHHCHIVPLLGYCSEFHGKFSKKLLVFEYMPNGNLRDCLDGILGETMNWQTRVTIAIGAARGLEYLHESAAPRILHRDVKSNNILMDENWTAKITDLGMAKRLRGDGVPSSSSSPARMQGTFGYFAPEYAMIGRASLMSDVFSFGVVLLELITGRQPIHNSTNKGEESLVLWATPRLQDSRRVIPELPDPRLKGNFPEEELQIMAYLAKECLLLDPDARPSMREVVQILSTIAPEKSKRRNIPVNLFQMPSIQSMKMEPHKEKPGGRAEGSIDAKEALKRDRSIQQSALDVEHDLFVGSNNVGADDISTFFLERLIHMTSKAQSWHASDDEAVDVTEPRLESFCMVNVKSP